MSRYDLFRRRIAPIAMVLAIGLIARDSCEKDKRAHTTVQLTFGDAKDTVRAVTVEVVTGGDTVATFHRAALPDRPIGPCEFKRSVPAEDGELRIDVDRRRPIAGRGDAEGPAGGEGQPAPGIDRGVTHQRLTRTFHIVEGSTMLVAIPDDDAPR